MKLRPLGDRVILTPVAKEEITKGGILLPDTADKERPEQGKVVAIGPGKLGEDGKRIEMSVKVGDTVLFKKYAPDEFKIDGETFLVLAESDLIAVAE